MWLVRDKRGNLWVHQEKPTKRSRTWNSNGKYYYIHSDLFPEVKWEDTEPRELILKPINKE